MSSRTLRRALAPCLLAGALVVAGCGDPAPDQAVRTGSAGQDPAAAPTTTTTTTAAASGAGATTTVATGTEGEPSPSVVAGLTPEQVRAAALAPPNATARRAPGATVEVVTLASGAKVWRVRIPGTFDARTARAAVSVGDRVVGTGILTPQLDALLAVTTDGTGLVAGAAVSYRWEGSAPVAAGTLGVAR